jgi:hypothetical protein
VQVAEQKVNVQTALVRLVNNQRVVAAQSAVALGLGQQHAVSHELDLGLRRGAVTEADLVADQLLLHPLGHGHRGNPARLGAANQLPFRAPACFQAHLGQLGGLAGAGVARNHHNLMGANGANNLVLAGSDGEFCWVVDAHDVV